MTKKEDIDKTTQVIKQLLDQAGEIKKQLQAVQALEGNKFQPAPEFEEKQSFQMQ